MKILLSIFLIIKSQFNKLKTLYKNNKVVTQVLLLGIAFELYIFYRLPKQAWVEGLLESWYTSKGLIFYKDFTNQYFPFLHMLMALYHQILGFTQVPTLILAPLNSLIILFVLFFLGIKLLTGWRRFLPMIYFLFWDPMLSENHFSTGAFLELINFIAFVLWLYWFDKPSKKLAFLVGFCLSASVFSMHITAFFVLAMFSALTIKIIVSKKYLDSLFFSILGFLIPPVIILLWFISKNAVYDLLWWNIIYYIKYYPYANLGRGAISIVMFFAMFSPLLIYSILVYFFSKDKSLFKLNLKDNQTLLKLILVTFILLSLPVSIWFGIFHVIRFQIALPIFALALGLGFEWGYKHRSLKIFLRLAAVAIILLNLLSFYYYMLPKYKSAFAYSRSHNIITKLYTDDPMYTAVKWIRENTPEGARLFVLADPLFYLETGRLPVNARGTMNQPFTYEPLSELSLQFRQKPPDYWVVDERLVHERFYQYGYPHTVKYFDKLLNCEPIAVKIEYITIRKHNKKTKLCISD